MEPPVGRIVDLSHVVDADTQVYPGDPTPSFIPAATLDGDGVNVLHVSMGSHTGPHVGAPYHVLSAGAPAHHVLLGAGGVIAENLTNLESADFPSPLVSVLPIRLDDADGSPVRAVAISLGRPPRGSH